MTRTAARVGRPAPAASGDSLGRAVLADAHVHWHECFDGAAFLDAAAQNFRAAATRLGLPAHTPGHLLLARSNRERPLRELAERGAEGWRFGPTREGFSWVARRADGATLVLIDGRQVATAEGVEVLALACSAALADGHPVLEVVREALGLGSLVVLPWGLGKWWFGRGRAVGAVLRSEVGPRVFVGDSSVRPRGWPRVGPWRLGAGILPGSDPLPIRRAQGWGGRCGFVVAGGPDLDRPGARVCGLVRRRERMRGAFGRRQGIPEAAMAQAALRVRRRTGALG